MPAKQLPQQVLKSLRDIVAETAAETGRQAQAAVKETIKSTLPIMGEKSPPTESAPPKPDIARLQEADAKEIAQLQAFLAKEKGQKEPPSQERQAEPAGAARNVENEMAAERRKRQERERQRIKEFVGKIQEQRSQEARAARTDAAIFAKKSEKKEKRRGGAFAHIKKAQTQVESRGGNE